MVKALACHVEYAGSNPVFFEHFQKNYDLLRAFNKS